MTNTFSRQAVAVWPARFVNSGEGAGCQSASSIAYRLEQLNVAGLSYFVIRLELSVESPRCAALHRCSSDMAHLGGSQDANFEIYFYGVLGGC